MAAFQYYPSKKPYHDTAHRRGNWGTIGLVLGYSESDKDGKSPSHIGPVLSLQQVNSLCVHK